MTAELEQLVRETVALTDVAPPSLLDGDEPTLNDEALSTDGFYLVGLIGGKDVGKSSLVNALVGEKITQTTSFGPGTETVIAYAHEAQVPALRELLESEAANQYRIVTHRNPQLGRQVLVDLPDIDSHWAGHVELTRRMLRHMLFPLWVQSVEKYADRQPQQLLATVAAGNAASNFQFCLNKADQLHVMSGGDPNAVEELRQDFAGRLGRTLQVPPPKVWMLSAASLDGFDLPALRTLLSRQKSTEIIKQSQESAQRQQDKSLSGWLDRQDLPGRVQRLARLEQSAQELLNERVAGPLVEKSLPALAEDPASRLALTDEVMAGRVARWPVVNLVHTLLLPVLAVVRRNVGVTRSAGLPDAEALVEAHLRINGVPLGHLVRTTFALLQQTNPQVSELYAQSRYWEDATADNASAKLRVTLTDTVDLQREQVRRRMTGRNRGLLAPLRWLLTIGAILWFPFLQPVLDILLPKDELNWSLIHKTHELSLLAVRIFSVNELLQNLTFLAMYFFVLWLILRWDTQRRIVWFSRKWKSDASDLSLTMETMRWSDDLVRPITAAREKVEALAKRVASIKPGSV